MPKASLWEKSGSPRVRSPHNCVNSLKTLYVFVVKTFYFQEYILSRLIVIGDAIASCVHPHYHKVVPLEQTRTIPGFFPIDSSAVGRTKSHEKTFDRYKTMIAIKTFANQHRICG